MPATAPRELPDDVGAPTGATLPGAWATQDERRPGRGPPARPSADGNAPQPSLATAATLPGLGPSARGPAQRRPPRYASATAHSRSRPSSRRSATYPRSLGTGSVTAEAATRRVARPPP